MKRILLALGIAVIAAGTVVAQNSATMIQTDNSLAMNATVNITPPAQTNFLFPVVTNRASIEATAGVTDFAVPINPANSFRIAVNGLNATRSLQANPAPNESIDTQVTPTVVATNTAIPTLTTNVTQATPANVTATVAMNGNPAQAHSSPGTTAEHRGVVESIVLNPAVAISTIGADAPSPGATVTTKTAPAPTS